MNLITIIDKSNHIYIIYFLINISLLNFFILHEVQNTALSF